MSQSAPRTYPIIKDAKPEVIVVHCGSPKLQGAFSEFIVHELGLAEGTYILLNPPGGGGKLVNPITLPKEFRSMKDTLEFYIDEFKTINRIVIINHANCGYFNSLVGRASGFAGKLFSDPHAGLKVAEEALKKMLGHLGIKFEMYFAEFADAEHTKVYFKKVV